MSLPSHCNRLFLQNHSVRVGIGSFGHLDWNRIINSELLWFDYYFLLSVRSALVRRSNYLPEVGIHLFLPSLDISLLPFVCHCSHHFLEILLLSFLHLLLLNLASEGLRKILYFIHVQIHLHHLAFLCLELKPSLLPNLCYFKSVCISVEHWLSLYFWA